MGLSLGVVAKKGYKVLNTHLICKEEEVELEGGGGGGGFFSMAISLDFGVELGFFQGGLLMRRKKA